MPVIHRGERSKIGCPRGILLTERCKEILVTGPIRPVLYPSSRLLRPDPLGKSKFAIRMLGDPGAVQRRLRLER